MELRQLVLDCPRFTVTPVTPLVSNGPVPQHPPFVLPQVLASVPVQPLMAPHASASSSDTSSSSHSSDFSDAASDVTSLTEDYSDLDALSAVPSAAGFGPDMDCAREFPCKSEQFKCDDSPEAFVMPFLPFGPTVSTVSAC